MERYKGFYIPDGMNTSLTYDQVVSFIRIKASPSISSHLAYEETTVAYNIDCSAKGQKITCHNCLLYTGRMDIFKEWLLEKSNLSKSDKLKLFLDAGDLK